MQLTDFTLQGFTNCREIDRGGSAIVYRADQPEFGRKVAIKLLSHFRDADAIERFNTERVTMGQLSHAQGIVSVYASGTTADGDPYLVLPYYENGSLQNYLDEYGAVTWRRATRHIVKVSRAVSFAHSKGVFHRDIKPANLLVADDGMVHIADFGIASLALSEPGEQLLCTPAFAPPEVLRGQSDCNPETVDVYGLGATLWALLTGEAPFVAEFEEQTGNYENYTVKSWATTMQLEAFAQLVETTPVTDLRPNVPEPICDVVDQAMAKNVGDRFGSVQAFSNALRHAVRLAAAELVQGASNDTSIGQLRAPNEDGSTVERTTLRHEALISTGNATSDSAPSDSTTERHAIVAVGTTDTSLSTEPSATSVLPKAPTSPPGSEPTVDDKNTGSFLLLITALVAAVVLIGGGLLYFLGARATSGAAVGDYVGGDLSTAEADAAEAEWDLTTTAIRQDGTEAGIVLEQDVPAGSNLEAGGSINLRVSEGQKLHRVPSVVGQAREEAESALLDANLAIGEVTEEINDDFEAGTVISVLVEGSPAGLELETGTPVDLLVSLGPAQITLPRVTTVEQAETTLGDELGFDVEVVEEFAEDVDEGTVIRTQPAAGEPATPGDVVVVFVSKGSQTTQIPNVIGLKKDDAIDQLEELGFEVEVDGNGPGNCAIKLVGQGKVQCDNYEDGRVWKYDPTGQVQSNGKVKIWAK